MYIASDDRYFNGIPSDSRVKTDGRFLVEEQVSGANLERIKALNDIASARGQSLAEMSLSWLLADEVVTSVIVGASKPEQILLNLKAMENTKFTDEELAAIDKLSV